MFWIKNKRNCIPPYTLVLLYITKTCPCNIQRFFFSRKNLKFHQKNVDIFLIFAQNIDCGYTLEPPRRGGSNEYPQSMFWSKNKKNRYTPANPSFTTLYIKVGFKGVYIIRTCFRDESGKGGINFTDTLS